MADPAARERILTTLTILVAERGNFATDLVAVLERAGVGEAEFHEHFVDLARQDPAVPDSTPALTAELTAGAAYHRTHLAVEAGTELEESMVRELMYVAVRPYLGVDVALAELDMPRPPA